MACKTIAVGYSGRGGNEYWQNGFAVEHGDIIGFVQTARRVLEEYRNSSSTLEELTTKAAVFIAENYSEERERELIVGAWQKILQT
jgi:hypothetical protein